MRYFLCLGILAAAVLVDGQSDFVSIDCGFSGDHAYSDPDTNLTYQPDAQFIDTGSNHELEYSFTNKPLQARNLRSFPVGIRNCYDIKNVIRGYKYLIRASFLYGNYDNDNPLTDNGNLTFDLYLGASLWKTMRIIDPDQLYIAEIITLASSDSFSICLVSTDNGIPFISALELRPISNGIYHDVNSTVSLLLWERLDMGSDRIVRYPDDMYDRKWTPDRSTDRSCSVNYYRCDDDLDPNSNRVATRGLVKVDENDPYAVPSVVMQTARMASDNTSLKLDFHDGNTGSTPPLFYIYLHFSELKAKASRVFRVEILGIEPKICNMTSEYLVESHVRMVYQAGRDPSTYFLTLTKMPKSMAPPMINAMEVYSKINLASIATDTGDVDAMMAIKRQYDIYKYSWQGDPCVPANLIWRRVNCTSSSSTPLRVTSLNLSSEGLRGHISTAIANLKALKLLDLSNNYLNGSIPNFLADLSALQIIDLSDNKLHGPMPADWCYKQAKGLLLLRLDNNPCSSGGACDCSKHNNRTQVLVISMAVTVVAVLILFSVFFLWTRRRGKRQPSTPQLKWRQIRGSSFHTDNPHFTYQDLRMITNNFERAIGKGGFGTVYYGRLPDGTEVAVKMQKRLLAIDEGVTEELKNEELSSYSHAIKEFQVEAQLLSRVHHRNLVSLIGYCNEGYSLGLVFEYAARGSLRDHLSETASNKNNLSWTERLRIAIDAAQGLEYLHKSCKPPIVHRDVKTSNILLSENFEAKIADFGLSKSFLSDAQTHISTHAVAGTPGYVDPEYHNTFRFNEKSDVYGFGIVLLELVTGLPAVLKFPETGHILQWVREGLARGNVTDIVDSRLKRQYDVYSVKKIIDLALHCTSMDANERPTMTVVLILLKESLQLELAREEPELSMSSSAEVTDVSRTGTSEITSYATELSGPSTR